ALQHPTRVPRVTRCRSRVDTGRAYRAPNSRELVHYGRRGAQTSASAAATTANASATAANHGVSSRGSRTTSTWVPMFLYTCFSCELVAASKYLPPVVSAAARSACRSTGTRRTRPSAITVPVSVPYAIVDTGMRARAAAAAAASVDRPTVVLPSDMTTMRAAGCFPLAGGGWVALIDS